MITSHPNAPEGEVLHLGAYAPSDFLPGSAILCRNNAPLIAMCYALLHRDVPCRILGRDIGSALSALVKKMRAASLDDLVAKLAVWHARESQRAIDDGRSPERLDDQHTCLLYFIESLNEDSQSVASLLAKIDQLFTDNTEDNNKRVTLSSVHKSKGLEYPTVFLLDRELYMPSRFARLLWQKEQETNLLYVAVTRAQQRLVYINSNCWKEETL